MAISLDDENINSDDEYKSKTQIKQEMADLPVLGKEIMALPESIYKLLSLPSNIDEAINTAKRINSFNAKKRQMQYIGKLLRKADIDEINDKIQHYKEGRSDITKQFHQMENLRNKLLANDKATLEMLLNRYPDCDKQQLRQLIRNAQKEQKLSKPPTQQRKLFQFIKTLFNS